MNIRELARTTFRIKGSSALVILCSSFAFISATGAVYNLAIEISNPVAWASLISSTLIYAFATSLIIADIFNAHEDNKLDTVLAKD